MYKSIFFPALTCLLGSALLADTNTFPLANNVGIGTLHPGSLLSVAGSLDVGAASYSGNAGTFPTGITLNGAAGAVGTASQGILFGGNGVAHGDLAWLPNERQFVLRSGNKPTDIVDSYGGVGLSLLGSVGIGLSTPAAKLDVSNKGNGSLAFQVTGGGGVGSTGQIVTNYGAVSVNGTNYIRNLGFYSYLLPIPSGVVDNGYRVGLDVENIVTDSTFAGTLYSQIGLWARVGSNTGQTPMPTWGTIQNSYALMIDNLDGPATVLNKYGVYQTCGTAKNFFAGTVGVGENRTDTKLDILQAGTGPTNIGIYAHVSGAGTNNYAGYFDASGASSNYALYTNIGNVALAATSGNVGIGTTNPTQKLSVNGTIQAKEIVVQTNWPDYVFDSAYHLPALSEVEAQIKAEKHLPGIPSAAEVGEHGVGLGEMEAKLLAKIEELTLHQIEQEKRIDRLERENAELRRTGFKE